LLRQGNHQYDGTLIVF